MSDIIKRLTVNDIFQIKCDALVKLDIIYNTEHELDLRLQEIGGHVPLRIDWRYGNYEENSKEKCIDRICWSYLIRLFNLKKYMLCTEYEKMEKEIEEFKTPDFTIENANAWLNGLKSLIHENVRTMLKSVYKNIITSTYYTGSGYSNQKKKKRNNNGIDEWFILSTNDYGTMYEYWRDHPSITDDLEKVCYILDGKSVPEQTIKDVMKSDKSLTGKNDYFEIRVCKNGNTHYRIFDETRNKLNLIGPDGNIIGEQIKIKIFDKW